MALQSLFLGLTTKSVSVTDHRGRVCYQLQNGKYKELTFKEFKETQDMVSPERIYYVYYRHVGKLVLRYYTRSPIEDTIP